ncbi:NUDIX hydrolase [Amnibacterium endophyticum]|uniref:NUDIX hydrolase n=1 Tax=Amnibacterium endophyticum TaxID=2109337 RepID=A0ABW4LFJ6_9MICO
MKDPPRPVVRNAARVLLIDPAGRVLLLRGGDSAAPEAGSWWITPGGGLEPGEDARAAAIREVEEETGHRLAGLGDPVLRRASVFPFGGRLLDQRELYFVARVPAFAPHTAGWTELERRELQEQRWWTLDELRTTEETVYPEALADLVAEALG